MSLMGIDVGTTRCKVAVYDDSGGCLATADSEYNISRPQPSQAELDAQKIWLLIKETIVDTVAGGIAAIKHDPIRSLAVASLGEATVPVTHDRRILSPSLLNSDSRGEEYLPELYSSLEEKWLYRINGNVLGNHYSLTKLLWIRDHWPDVYRQTYKFLHWGPFVSFMLGAKPAVDYSLANRSLLFDINKKNWSEEIIQKTGLDKSKLPEIVEPGQAIGTVDEKLASELGLSPNVTIAAGAHDQCANALGCGVINEGDAMCGMGTVTCISPVFRERKEASLMMSRGLNTEHHAVPGRFVSFIYNQGGCLLKWFCDSFLAEERQQIEEDGGNIYEMIISEMPENPSSVIVLPHFDVTGPPEFITDSSGVIIGLKLDTQRGDILKGILEGSIYYLRECVESLPGAGIHIEQCRAVGGGSMSDEWVQLCADILGLPFIRPTIREAGTLGAAMLGGLGKSTFRSASEAVRSMVKDQDTFQPDMVKHQRYEQNYRRYKRVWPLMKDFLTQDKT